MKPNSMPLAARLGSCAVLATLAALPLGAAAATDPTHGFSIGAGAGSNSVEGSDYTGNGNHVDDTQMAWKGLVAYRLNRGLSLEAQYVDFGTAEGGGNSVNASGVTAGGVFEAAMSRSIHPYAKAGALFWDAEENFNPLVRNDTGIDFTYGGGLRFILGRSIDVRTEYERFEFNATDVHTISAMLQFKF